MTVFQYFRDDRPWSSEQIESPTWADVEAAIRRMDNYCFPVVWLNCDEDDNEDESEDIFCVIGGDGRWTLFRFMGEWNYEDPNGGDGEVRLWESDQGCFCRERNVITEAEKVLRITKKYYETGTYDNLDDVA